jgi:hypothetical protein
MNKEQTIEKEYTPRQFARVFEKCVSGIDLITNGSEYEVDYVQMDYKMGNINVIYRRIKGDNFPQSIVVCLTRGD